MKQIRWAVITLFAAMILLPLAAFDREADVVSAIDNRKLAAAPFSEEAKAANADLTARIEKYVNDRIGFRDQMILGVYGVQRPGLWKNDPSLLLLWEGWLCVS